MAKATPDKGYQKLKSDLSSGEIGQVYIFHGEESYLREYYLGALKKVLVPAGFEEFNYHALDGKTLSMQALGEVVDAMPMLAERTMVAVTDCDLYKLGESQRNMLIEMLEDFPDYCCLVLVYDTLEYKPNKVYKKLYGALEKRAVSVNFQIQQGSDLINWVRRRFRALDREIDDRTAEHLIFTCGALMTGLVPEIAKIAAYSKGRVVTAEEIDAVADPVLDAEIFNMTNAVTRGDYNAAADILGRLLKQQEEPFMILSVIAKELRRIYDARVAVEEGKGTDWLMKLWNMRSEYPARLLMDAARRTTLSWCENSLRLCRALDLRLKSARGVDDEGELKLLLMELAQKKTA